MTMAGPRIGSDSVGVRPRVLLLGFGPGSGDAESITGRQFGLHHWEVCESLRGFLRGDGEEHLDGFHVAAAHSLFLFLQAITPFLFSCIIVAPDMFDLLALSCLYPHLKSPCRHGCILAQQS